MDTSNMTDAEVEAEYAKQFPDASAPTTIPTVQEESPSIASQPAKTDRGTLSDLGIAAVHGVESAVRETGKTALELGKHLLPPGVRDSVDPASAISDDTFTPKPETMLGKIESDIVRFTTGFIGAGAMLKGAGFVAGAAKSALATGVTSNPNAERLSNFIQEHPYLENPVTEYLSAKPGDSLAEGKLKSAVEDLGLSAVGGLLFKGLKLAKDSLSSSVVKTHETVNPFVVSPTKSTELVDSTGEPVNIGENKVTSSAESIGLRLTPEHTTKLAGMLDEIRGKTYQGADISADAAKPSLLNTAKMQTSDDVKATLNKFGEVLGPIMKSQGWTEHQTHIETLNLAEQLAVDPDVLMGSLTALGHDAATIPQTLVAGRMLLQTQASDLFTTARKAAITGEGKDEAIAALGKVAQTLAHIKMVTTGAARTTESGRLAVGELDPERLAKWITKQGGSDNVLQKIAMTEGDPTALAQLARSTDDVAQDFLDSAWKVHNTVWINGLLSSPKTQIVNAVSTGINVLAQPLNLMIGGTMRRDWNDVREGVALYHGLGTFLNDSFLMAKKSLATETQILGGNKVVEPSAAMIDSHAGWAQALRFPTRLLGASDEFFKQLSYRAKVSAQATREGMDAVKSGTITQGELDGFISTKFAAAFDKTGAALNEEALKFAEVSTFTQSLDRPTWLGNWAEGISALSSHPALRGTVLPFIRVPSNLLRQVFDYTPIVGQLRKKFLVDMQAGGSQASEALGRMTVGTGLWVGAGMLALDGKITGAAPRDPDLAAAMKAVKWQPYSFVVSHDDGTKTYIAFNRLDPFASFLGLAADFAQIHAHLPANKADEWAAIASLSLSNNLMSKSYLKGALDTMTALAGNSPKRAESWIRQRVASYIPSIVGVVQPDTEMKELRTWLDGAMAKVPGLSATLEAKRDIFGQKVQPLVGYPQSAWNPFQVSQDSNNDPVLKELARLAQSDAQSQFSTAQEDIGNVSLLNFRKKSGQTAYDRLLELSGQGLKEAFAWRMQQASYIHGTDGDSYYTASTRANMLRDVQNRYKAAALRKVQEEFPDLRDALRADKQNALDTKTGKAPRNAMDTLRQFGQ